MSFCPKCRYEYNPEISVCPDCEETLVDLLPEKTKTDAENSEIDDQGYDDWIKIGNLTSQAYATMINEGLKSKNIPVVILSGAGYFGQTGQMGISSILPAGGGYLVLVPEEFVEDAHNEAEIILGDDWIKVSEE